MAKKCDFLLEKGSRYYCLLIENNKEDGEISEQTYKCYCKFEETKLCPIWIHYDKERR